MRVNQNRDRSQCVVFCSLNLLEARSTFMLHEQRILIFTFAKCHDAPSQKRCAVRERSPSVALLCMGRLLYCAWGRSSAILSVMAPPLKHKRRDKAQMKRASQSARPLFLFRSSLAPS